MVLLLYILLPLIVFKSLLDEVAIFRETFSVYATFFLAGSAVSFLIAYFAIRLEDRVKRYTALLASTLRNAFFIPISLVIALDLPEGAIIGVVAFTICYHLFQPFFTMFLAMRAHGSYATDVLIKGLTFPPLRAAIIGYLLGSRGFNFHLPAFHELKLLSAYLSLLYVGIVLAKSPKVTKKDVSIIARVGLIRLLIVPLVLMPFYYYRPYPENVVIAREIGGPTSVSAVLYAVLFGFDDELMAKIVVYVTFIAIIVLPLRHLILAP